MQISRSSNERREGQWKRGSKSGGPGEVLFEEVERRRLRIRSCAKRRFGIAC